MDSYLIPGWPDADKVTLLTEMLRFSVQIIEQELNAKIALLHKENKDNSLNQIALLESERSQLHRKTLLEVALPLSQDYDWAKLARTLNGRHTAQECTWVWKLVLHPTINKRSWSRVEVEQLQVLAARQDLNMQEWDNIARALNTGRSGFQCFLLYCSIRAPIECEWTVEDTEFTHRVIDFFGEGYISAGGLVLNWDRVAAFMLDVQKRNKSTSTFRKSNFQEDEDMIMLNCHELYGSDFIKIATYIPGRTPDELEARFNFLIKHGLYKTWSVEDDRKLIEIMENDEMEITNIVHAFPEKKHVRHIWARLKTLCKWMMEYPDVDISVVPRRQPKSENDYRA